MVKYLVKQGEDINEQDEKLETSLYKAVKNGQEEIVNYLLESEVDPNISNKNLETPLFKACENEHKNRVKFFFTLIWIKNKYKK